MKTSSEGTLAAGESSWKVLRTASLGTAIALSRPVFEATLPSQNSGSPEPIETQAEQGNSTCAERRSLAAN